MDEDFRSELSNTVRNYRLPRYCELPDMGLFLDQVVRYVNKYLACFGYEITASMVSNYVKQRIIPGPVRKCYGIDSIACLMYVSFIKNVVQLEDIRFMFKTQQQSYELAVAYDYFCEELENLLHGKFYSKLCRQLTKKKEKNI